MMRKLSYDDWHAEGVAKFGPDEMTWRFRCPSCGHIATPTDWKNVGAPEGAVAFSCVGRWAETTATIFEKGKGPCNYAGGGLFGLNPVTVEHTEGRTYKVFEFDAATPAGKELEAAHG